MSKEDRNKRVQILAVNAKYKERPGYICPIYNPKTRKYETGLEDLQPAPRGVILSAMGVDTKSDKGLKMEDLYIPIHHRQVLNLADDEHYGIYKLCLVNDTVAKSSRAVLKDKHLFFINDVDAEAAEDLSMETLRFQAKQNIFNEADNEKIKSLCIYLGGIDVRNLSHNSLLAKALKEAEARPKAVIEFYEGNVDLKVFLLELNHYGILQYTKGKFMDGEVYLGTHDEAVVFLSDPKNSSTVNSLGKRLLEKKG